MRAQFLAAVLLVAATPALAQESSSLTLQTPVAKTTQTLIDGVDWTCTGASCVSTPGGQSQSVERACRRVVAQLGPVAAFSWQGRALAPDKLPACNAAARH